MILNLLHTFGSSSGGTTTKTSVNTGVFFVLNKLFNNMLRSIIILLALFYSLGLMGQNDERSPDELGKNSVFATMGYGYHNPDLAYGFGLTYERQLVKFSNSYLFAQGGWSYWFLWGVSANSYQLDVAYLLGSKSSHLELDLGIDYACIADDYEGVFDFTDGEVKLLANVAYRYQKPGKRTVFRIGVGTVALAFVSLGISF